MLKPAIRKEKLNMAEPKRILVAGAGSYIGESFIKYISQFENYSVSSFSTLDDGWKSLDFSQYDSILDVAGIAHIKETDQNRDLYYKVNRDLALEIAKKAKSEGVKQFIYLSSMSVYGLLVGNIDESTPLQPVNAYGKSKLEAENLLWELNDNSFSVAILRPPMVYGEGCKGNYQMLKKFALKFGFFPDYPNKRSMVFIDNLSAAIRGIIHNNEPGLYFPQDPDYVNTCEMVRDIAVQNGKKFHSTKLMNLPIKLFAGKVGVFKKVFGSLTYEKNLNVPTAWMEGDGPVPLVSVITVSYNSGKTIAKTIEAVLNQTYSNIEYIIVDGASKDDTVEVARSYQQQFDEKEGRKLIVISEPDKGMYDALNKGAKLASGVLVGQTNADDHYEPDAIEKMVRFYKKTSYDVAWGSIRVLKPAAQHHDQRHRPAGQPGLPQLRFLIGGFRKGRRSRRHGDLHKNGPVLPGSRLRSLFLSPAFLRRRDPGGDARRFFRDRLRRLLRYFRLFGGFGRLRPAFRQRYPGLLRPVRRILPDLRIPGRFLPVPRLLSVRHGKSEALRRKAFRRFRSILRLPGHTGVKRAATLAVLPENGHGSPGGRAELPKQLILPLRSGLRKQSLVITDGILPFLLGHIGQELPQIGQKNSSVHAISFKRDGGGKPFR